jgi:hypothetical protein
LFAVNKRQPGILTSIEADLERAPEEIDEEIEVKPVALERLLAG